MFIRHITSLLLAFIIFGGHAVSADAGQLGQATPEQLLSAQETGTVIIDIRLEDEWRSTGIITGAETITAFMGNGQIHPDFMTHFQSVAPSQDTAVLIYCRTGNRTNVLGNALIQQLGYKNVTHLSDGITGWLGAGHDVAAYQP